MNEVVVIAGSPPMDLEPLARLIRQYLRQTNVQKAIVFGSFARDEADLVSDLDLVLIEPSDLMFLERGRNHLDLFRLGIGIDLLVYTPEEYQRLIAAENPLIERVEREGRVIYARPESGSDTLEEPSGE